MALLILLGSKIEKFMQKNIHIYFIILIFEFHFFVLQGIYFESNDKDKVLVTFQSLSFEYQGPIIHRNALTRIRYETVKNGIDCVYKCPISSTILSLLKNVFDGIDKLQFNFVFKYLEENVQSLSAEGFVDIVTALIFLEANDVLDLVLWFCPLQQEDAVINLLKNQSLDEIIAKITCLKSLITLRVGVIEIPLSGILARYFPLIRTYFWFFNKVKNDFGMTGNFDLAWFPALNYKWYENCKNNLHYIIDIPFVPDFDPEQYKSFFENFFDLITYYNKSKRSHEIINRLNTCGNEEFVKFVLFYLDYFEFFDEYTNFSNCKILENPVTIRSNELRKDINKFVVSKKENGTLKSKYPNIPSNEITQYYSPYDVLSDRKSYPEIKSKVPVLSKTQKGLIISTLSSFLAFTPWLIKKIKRQLKYFQKRNVALKTENKSDDNAISVKDKTCKLN